MKKTTPSKTAMNRKKPTIKLKKIADLDLKNVTGGLTMKPSCHFSANGDR